MNKQCVFKTYNFMLKNIRTGVMLSYSVTLIEFPKKV